MKFETYMQSSQLKERVSRVGLEPLSNREQEKVKQRLFYRDGLC